MASPWTLEQINKLEKSGQLSPETAQAARTKIVPLSADQQTSVANYIKSDPIQQQTDQLLQANANDPFLRSMHGEGDFRDTGRKSDGLGESIDSVLGVPARVLANEIVQGKATPESFAKAVQSVGTDPRNAPTGHDVALNAGVSDKPMGKVKGSTLANIASHIPGVGHFVNAAKNFMSKEVADREFEPSPADVLGTAIDFGAQVPVATMGKVAGGVVGAVKKVGKAVPELKEAQAILSKIDTPEKAIALKGADKEAYMNALDQVYGPREQRAADMGLTKFKVKNKPHEISVKTEDSSISVEPGGPGESAWVNELQAGNNSMGLGSKTLQQAEYQAKKRGAKNIMLTPDASIEPVFEQTSKTQPELEQWYKRKGYANNEYIEDYQLQKKLLEVVDNKKRDIEANLDPRFKDSPLLLAAKTGIASIDDFNTIAKTEQAKKVSKAGTLAQEGYTFGRNYKDDGVEIIAKWRGKEVGKAVITKDGVSHSQVDSLHKGKGIDEELVRFGSTEKLAGKSGAANAEDLGSASKAESLLSKIDTPEKAAALKGAEREEYLKALDEVYGPREQRARDLGFGDETHYHGTNKDFDSFSAKNLGESGRKHGEQYFVSDNPEVANQFADHAADNDYIKHGKIDFKKDQKLAKAYEKAEAAGKHRLAEQIDQQRLDMRRVGGNVLPVKVRTEDPYVTDARESYFTEPRMNRVFKNSKSEGFDSVIINNLLDNPSEDVDIVSKITAVPNANQIRSTNAAFDPRFKDSSNLLAGQAGPVPRYLMPMSEDEEDDFLDEAASIGNDADLENYLNHILNQRGQ